MTNCDYMTYPVRTLRTLAAQHHIKYYSRLRKNELVQALLQATKEPPTKRRRTSQKYLNDTDFETLEPFDTQGTWFVHKNYRFLPDTLTRYFHSEGKFENPYTRVPFTDEDLKELSLHTTPQVDLVALKEKWTRQRHEERERIRTADLLAEEAYELLREIVDPTATSAYEYVVSHLIHDLYNLHRYTLPNFLQAREELRRFDQSTAEALMRRIIHELTDLLSDTDLHPQFRQLAQATYEILLS